MESRRKMIQKLRETESFEMPEENIVDESAVVDVPSEPEFNFERDTGIIFEHAIPSDKPFKLRNTLSDIPRLESVKAEVYNKQMEEVIKNTSRSSANYSDNFGKTQATYAPKPKQSFQDNLVTENTTAVQQNTYNNKNNSQSNTTNNNTTNTAASKSTKNKKLDKKDVIEYYTGYDNTEENQSFEQNTNKKSQDNKGKRFIKSIGKLFSTEEDDDDEIL